MTTLVRVLVCVFVCAGCFAADEEGFVPLFNGKDLSGWVPVNVAPNTFTVKDEIIVCSGKPTGVMRTEKHYENFILEMEWRHMYKGGNAGLFIYGDPVTSRGVPFTRGVEIQVLDGDDPKGNWTGHGDIFPIHGATMKPDRPHPGGWPRCLPSEKRAKPAGTGEWNHYRVESRDGRVTLAVNGKVVSGGSECKPRRGYICLESEGSEAHFRNIKIKELPSSNPPPEETAKLDEGFVSIYNGFDLSGWKQEDGHKDHWKATDWVLDYDGKSTAQDPSLWTEKEYEDFMLIADWRFSRKPEERALPIVLPDGSTEKDAEGKEKLAKVPDSGDSGIYLRGNSKSQINIWCWPVGSGEIYGYRTAADATPEVKAACVPKLKADAPLGQWNRFVITVKGESVTVVLNDKTVIDNARLPGMPKKGRIALQHHGDPIQFANIYVKELKAP